MSEAVQHADRELADPRGAEALSEAPADRAVAAPAEASLRWRLFAWAGLAAMLAVLAVQYSLRDGRLSVPADWDDVMYMTYSAERVNDLYTAGFRACLDGWLRNTPHSPVSCVVAFAAFLVFGMQEWAPYAACALIVFAVLFLADWVMGRQPLGMKVLTSLYLCTVPMLTYAVTDFKPDVMWGMAVSAVAAVCILRPVVGARSRHLVMLGALCALALLTKPTTTPGTLALLGLCGLLGTVKDWVILGRRPGVLEVGRSWSYVLVTTSALAGPFYYLHWDYFNYYIHETLFGEYKATWYISGGWPAQFRYFITGPGGTANLAGHLYLIPVVWLVGWGVAIWCCDRAAIARAACLLVMAGACYAMPTINPAKNTFLASPFYAIVIVTTAYWVGYLAVVERRRFGASRVVAVGLLAMLAVGLLLYRWPSAYYGPGGLNRADVGRLHREVYDTLLRQVKPYPQLTTVTATGPIRQITLSWYATRDRAPLTFDRPYSAKVSDYEPYIDRSDFVLAQEDHVAGSVSIMPNEQVQGEVLALMRLRQDYRPLTEFTAADGKKLVLFQRTQWTRGVTMAVRAVDGFGPVQGPYPDSDLPMFIWGLAGGSSLVLTPEHAGPATLRLECRASNLVQSVRFVSGSTVLGTHQFGGPWVSETFEIAVPSAVPAAKVRIEYIAAEQKSPGAAENAVLFTKIALVPAGGPKSPTP